MNEGGIDIPGLAHDINQQQKLDGYLTKVVSGAGYTFSDKDRIKRVEASTGVSDRTFTLPTLADNQNRVIEVFKTDHSVGHIICDGEGAETINGLAQVKTNGRYCGFRFKAQVTEWHCETIQNEKQYIVDNTYNAVAITITESTTNWTTDRGILIPYFTMQGDWRLRFNISGIIDAVKTNIVITIPGTTYKAGYSHGQAITSYALETGVIWCRIIYAWATNGGTTLVVDAQANFDQTWFSGDIELASKPTWCD